jgi:hypothetical protein
MVRKYKVKFKIPNIQGFSHLQRDVFSKKEKIYYLGVCFQEKGDTNIKTYILRSSNNLSSFLQETPDVKNEDGIIQMETFFYQEIGKFVKYGGATVGIVPQQPEKKEFSIRPCLIARDASDIEVLNPSRIEIGGVKESKSLLYEGYVDRDIEVSQLSLPVLDTVDWSSLEINEEIENEEIKKIEEETEEDKDILDKENDFQINVTQPTPDDEKEEIPISFDDYVFGENKADFFNPEEDDLEEKGFQFQGTLEDDGVVKKIYENEKGAVYYVTENNVEKVSLGQIKDSIKDEKEEIDIVDNKQAMSLINKSKEENNGSISG